VRKQKNKESKEGITYSSSEILKIPFTDFGGLTDVSSYN